MTLISIGVYRRKVILGKKLLTSLKTPHLRLHLALCDILHNIVFLNIAVDVKHLFSSCYHVLQPFVQIMNSE